MNGSTVLQVSHHRDRKTIDGTEFFTDRVDVEESLYGNESDQSKNRRRREREERAHLSRVFSDTISSVDDGNGRVTSSFLCASNTRVTKSNHVTVATESANGIGESFSLDDRGHSRSNGESRSSETSHGSFERSRSASRRFVEESAEYSSSHDVDRNVSLSEHSHFGSDTEENVKIISSESANRKNVSTLISSARGREKLDERVGRRGGSDRSKGRSAGQRHETGLKGRIGGSVETRGSTAAEFGRAGGDSRRRGHRGGERSLSRFVGFAREAEGLHRRSTGRN